MKTITFNALICLCLAISGCTLPQLIQPLRLYDLKSGNIIEVVLHPTSPDHGTIYSSGDQKDQFEGEYVLYDRFSNIGPFPVPSRAMGTTRVMPDSVSLPELYGFGKNSDARPVGTGVIVASDSTVVEIIFYRISADQQTGDGVARDNKGRYYRVYFSTEEVRNYR